ncbi:MAG: sodium:calcium antiporter [Candidatus Nanoarchaeia archaeon]|nr:sodium:calcium antiporter [Candidatus Nanoarchaeia archaeon]
MLIGNVIFFIVSLYLLIKSSDWAIKYSTKVSKVLQLSSFVVSFMIVSVISAIPETAIALISVFEGKPSLGLGTLLGSNVADLTLIFGLVALLSVRGIKVKSSIVRREFLYLLLLSLPLILGFDGELSRVDGLVLILAGIFFFITLYRDSKQFSKKYDHIQPKSLFDSSFFLLLSLGALVTSAFFTVKFAINIAEELKIPSMLIGLVIISIGTCLPEFLFSLRAMKRKQDSMALGDILGTVMTDATIILGAIALISPFTFEAKTMIVTSSFMLLAGIIATWFVRSDMKLTEKEGLMLLFFYFIFLLVEFLVTLGHL